MPITTECRVFFEPENERLVIAHVDAGGVWDLSKGVANIDLRDLIYAAATAGGEIQAAMRRVHYIDQAGAKKRLSGLFTGPVSDASDDGHSSATEDLYLGGGGGVTLFTLVTFQFNYLVCAPDGGGSNIVVALEPQLKDTIASQGIGVETWTYDNYDGTDQSRDATCGAITEHQYITPRFIAGDRIPVQACLNTGLSADGTSGLYILTAEVDEPGTGYAVNDVLDVVGGTGEGATLTVTSIDGNGGITGLDITTPGEYTVAPPLAATVSPHATGGGSGINATVTLTISPALEFIALTGRQWAKEHEEPAA